LLAAKSKEIVPHFEKVSEILILQFPWLQRLLTGFTVGQRDSVGHFSHYPEEETPQCCTVSVNTKPLKLRKLTCWTGRLYHSL